MHGAFFILNTNLIVLDALRDALSGAPITNAGVTCTLYNAIGDEVAGQAWPLAMVHQGNGVYVGTLEPTLDLSEHERYMAVIRADAGSLRGRWEITRVARRRTA